MSLKLHDSAVNDNENYYNKNYTIKLVLNIYDPNNNNNIHFLSPFILLYFTFILILI